MEKRKIKKKRTLEKVKKNFNSRINTNMFKILQG